LGADEDGGTDGGKGGFWRGCTFVDLPAAAAAARGTELPRLPNLIEQAAEERVRRE
jgi:hypothetical protein